MKYTIFFIMLILALPAQARADWSGAGMHPIGGPNLTSPQRIEPQHRVESQIHAQQAQPVEHHVSPVEKRTQCSSCAS